MNCSELVCLAVVLVAVVPSAALASPTSDEDAPKEAKETKETKEPREVKMTSALLHKQVTTYSAHVASVCYFKGAPPKLRVQVAARPKTQRFEVKVDQGSEEFRKCFEQRMRERLRSDFSVQRKLPNGEHERIVRIDAPATATHTFTVENPKDLTPPKIDRAHDFNR